MTQKKPRYVLATPADAPPEAPPEPEEYATVPPAVFQQEASVLSDRIRAFVIHEVQDVFGGRTPPVHAADGMKVAMMGMALAEGMLLRESVKTGLNLQQLCAVHDALVKRVLIAPDPGAGSGPEPKAGG